MFLNILILIRIKDWLKNTILFIPLIFSENLVNSDHYFNLFLSVIIFSIATSIIYIINDIADLESDKKHLIKMKIKPLANGAISVSFAKRILIFLIFLLIIMISKYNLIFYHILGYLILSLSYNFIFKNIFLIDIFIISIGYILRVDSGSETINVQSSTLMLLSIFSLAFFVLVIKRKNEFENNKLIRVSLKFYNKNIFNILVFLSFLSSIILYSTYIYLKNLNLVYTLPIATLFMIRYIYVTQKNKKGEFPIDLFFKDLILLILGIIYLVMLLQNFIW